MPRAAWSPLGLRWRPSRWPFAAAGPLCGGLPAATRGPVAYRSGGLQKWSGPVGLKSTLPAFPAGHVLCTGRPGLLLPGDPLPGSALALGLFALAPAHGGFSEEGLPGVSVLSWEIWQPLAP